MCGWPSENDYIEIPPFDCSIHLGKAGLKTTTTPPRVPPAVATGADQPPQMETPIQPQSSVEATATPQHICQTNAPAASTTPTDVSIRLVCFLTTVVGFYLK